MTQPNSYKKSSFGPAFFFLSKEERTALADYYEFCRLMDDIADEPCENPQEQLDFWTEEIHRIYNSTPQTDLGKRLQKIAKTYRVQPEQFLLLIEGMRADLAHKTYASLKELSFYLHCVAVVVGQTTLNILQIYGRQADELAFSLGNAVQLTNIVRDSAEDARRGRVYLPIKTTPQEVLTRPMPPKIQAELKNLAVHARDEYQDAFLLMKQFSPLKMLPCRIMGYVYLKNLAKIERDDFNSLWPLKLTKGEKIRAVLYALWKTFF